MRGKHPRVVADVAGAHHRAGGTLPGEHRPLHSLVVIGPRLEGGVAQVCAIAAGAVAGVLAVVIAIDPERCRRGAHVWFSLTLPGSSRPRSPPEVPRPPAARRR